MLLGLVHTIPDGRAFEGEAGSARRLRELLGGPHPREVFECRNLLPPCTPWPGIQQARAYADAIATQAEFAGLQGIIGAGKQVCLALGHDRPRWFEEFDLDGFPLRVVCFPHPSGRSRYWNDPVNLRRAGEVLRRLAGLPNPL